MGLLLQGGVQGGHLLVRNGASLECRFHHPTRNLDRQPSECRPLAERPRLRSATARYRSDMDDRRICADAGGQARTHGPIFISPTSKRFAGIALD